MVVLCQKFLDSGPYIFSACHNISVKDSIFCSEHLDKSTVDDICTECDSSKIVFEMRCCDTVYCSQCIEGKCVCSAPKEVSRSSAIYMKHNFKLSVDNLSAMMMNQDITFILNRANEAHQTKLKAHEIAHKKKMDLYDVHIDQTKLKACNAWNNMLDTTIPTKSEQWLHMYKSDFHNMSPVAKIWMKKYLSTFFSDNNAEAFEFNDV